MVEFLPQRQIRTPQNLELTGIAGLGDAVAQIGINREASRKEDVRAQDLASIAVHASEGEYCLALSVSLGPTGNAPVSAVYLFGDAGAYFSGERKPSIPVLVLTALGEALKRSHNHLDLEVTGLGCLAAPGSWPLH